MTATIPTWIAGFLLGRDFWRQNQLWGGDLAVPEYLRGIGLAAFVGTLVGIFILLLDLNSWLKKRKLDERASKAN